MSELIQEKYATFKNELNNELKMINEIYEKLENDLISVDEIKNLNVKYSDKYRQHLKIYIEYIKLLQDLIKMCQSETLKNIEEDLEVKIEEIKKKLENEENDNLDIRYNLKRFKESLIILEEAIQLMINYMI